MFSVFVVLTVSEIAALLAFELAKEADVGWGMVSDRLSAAGSISTIA